MAVIYVSVLVLKTVRLFLFQENVYATEKNEAKGGKVESKTGKNEPDKNPTEADSQVDGESKPTDSKSSTNNFIADIKNAAHQAQNDAGFIYEPTSGLYYDSRTGYYYNAVCWLKLPLYLVRIRTTNHMR